MRPWIRGIGSAFTLFPSAHERRLRLIENSRPDVLISQSWKMVGDALRAGMGMYEANHRSIDDPKKKDHRARSDEKI